MYFFKKKKKKNQLKSFFLNYYRSCRNEPKRVVLTSYGKLIPMAQQAFTEIFNVFASHEDAMTKDDLKVLLFIYFTRKESSSPNYTDNPADFIHSH